MKICFIAPKAYQLFNPKVRSTFGGAEVQLYFLAKELSQKNKADVHFMVADYGQASLEKFDGVRVWRSLSFLNGSVRQMIDFYQVFNKVDAEVYVQRTLSHFSGLLALLCWLKKKKFVYMVAHDSELDNSLKDSICFLKFFLADLVFRFANLVIVQNSQQWENLKKNKNREAVLINSSYPMGEMKGKCPKHILWVGRSEAWKNPEMFLRLADAFPLKKFVMICPSATNNPELHEMIRAQAKAKKNVEFLDFVPFPEIDEYFRTAEILVNTSTQEGFPNTFIQAAKNKVPVLSLNVNPSKILDEFNMGYCCDNDFSLLKKHLSSLFENKVLYHLMCNNAYDYAREKHDLKANSKYFFELLETIL